MIQDNTALHWAVLFVFGIHCHRSVISELSPFNPPHAASGISSDAIDSKFWRFLKLPEHGSDVILRYLGALIHEGL